MNALAVLEAGKLVGPGEGEVLWSKTYRHDTVLIRDAEKQSWFVKLCGKPMTSGEVSLVNEVRFHRALAAGSVPKELQRFVPRLIMEREVGSVLVFEGYPLHDNMRNCLLNRVNGVDLQKVAKELGRALALLHSTSAEKLSEVDFPIAAQQVVTYGRVTPDRLVNSPGCFSQFLRLIQATSLNDNLRRLRASWHPHCLTHGDMKLDNLLVRCNHNPGPTLLITDWELAGLGDAQRDCGAIIGSCYFTWLERCYPGGTEFYDEEEQQSLQTIVHVFLEAYAEHRQLAVDYGTTLAWAGYWLTQRVMAALPLRRRLAPIDLAAMYLAQQLLAEITIGTGSAS